jgi:hypothetical protein
MPPLCMPTGTAHSRRRHHEGATVRRCDVTTPTVACRGSAERQFGYRQAGLDESTWVGTGRTLSGGLRGAA